MLNCAGMRAGRQGPRGRRARQPIHLPLIANHSRWRVRGVPGAIPARFAIAHVQILSCSVNSRTLGVVWTDQSQRARSGSKAARHRRPPPVASPSCSIPPQPPPIPEKEPLPLGRSKARRGASSALFPEGKEVVHAPRVALLGGAAARAEVGVLEARCRLAGRGDRGRAGRQGGGQEGERCC